MSKRDYEVGRLVESAFRDDDYYGVVQGLMRMSDSDNILKLQRAFPEVHAELVARYNAPGGIFPGEER